MKQVLQSVRTGETAVHDVPDPIASPGHLVVATVASLISAGTERYVVELAKKSLLAKARARPDHVRRVIEKIRQEGLLMTAQQVMAKLDEPMPLGYSSAGIVLEAGAGVQSPKPGDRVAMVAPHAGVVQVGRNLCARIPDGVSFEQAAYTAVASIALQGVRLARPALGERVLVIGLGLIGQICVALLKAQGCRVFGVDVDPAKLELARRFGADAVGLGSPRSEVEAFSSGVGVDSVLITAATESNAPIELAADAARVKGRIVLVGVAGLNVPRPPFFLKELEFTVSSSLGPGRGDPSYEERGIDYPIGHARWTAQRNMEAVLDTIAAGRLPVEHLTTHRFPIDAAAKAYDLITAGTEPHYGVVLNYPTAPTTRQRVVRLERAKTSGGDLGLSMIGAGNFARLILMPILAKTGVSPRYLATAKGVNAKHSGEKMGFAFATTEVEEIWNDQTTRAVMIATRHDLHAELVIAGLRAGKHVFVEKPLCISLDELKRIDEVVTELGDNCPILMVGFNRRFAPATKITREWFEGSLPLNVSFRFAPGALPASAWPHDEAVGGGRLVGEACHAIDTCVALVDSPPVRVFAESVGRVGGLEITDDRVFITVRHENGCVSNISYQAGGDRSSPPERIEVYGGGKTAFVENWNDIELFAGGRSKRRSGGKDKGHALEIEAFLAACRRGGRWPIPWQHLYGTTWASLAAVRSLREGRPINLGDEAE